MVSDNSKHMHVAINWYFCSFCFNK